MTDKANELTFQNDVIDQIYGYNRILNIYRHFIGTEFQSPNGGDTKKTLTRCE